MLSKVFSEQKTFENALRLAKRVLGQPGLRQLHPAWKKMTFGVFGQRVIPYVYYATALSCTSKLTVDQIIQLLHNVAVALVFLHTELGVVHGDFKPENLVCEDGHYITIDFDRAVPKGHPLEHGGGTRGFQAPELKGKKSTRTASTANDMYALGVTVGTFLFKVNPYKPKTKSNADVQNELLCETQKTQPHFANAKRNFLSDLVAKLLSPAQRRPSAEDCVEAVRPFLRTT
jgi:serine/threonine protein kinase